MRALTFTAFARAGHCTYTQPDRIVIAVETGYQIFILVFVLVFGIFRDILMLVLLLFSYFFGFFIIVTVEAAAFITTEYPNFVTITVKFIAF